MVTIIFSDAQDNDCELILRRLEEIPNMYIRRFIHLTPDKDIDEDIIDSAISEETDTLFLIGHGTSNGLLGPNRNGEYVIHQFNAEKIVARQVVCVWCYAADFVNEHIKNPSFATGMFISNVDEAYDNGIVATTWEIEDTCNTFYADVLDAILHDVNIEDYSRILEYRYSTCVELFNKDNCRIIIPNC